jgi:beta-glucanase (GH16 family)
MSSPHLRDRRRPASGVMPRRALDENEMSPRSEYRVRKPKRRRSSLRMILWTGLVVLSVVASFAVLDVWRRVGAVVLSPTTSSTTTTVVLDESFDGTTLDTTVWNTCHWWNDNGCTISSNDELEWYRPEQVSVAGGALRLTADRVPTHGSDGKNYDYRSGMVTTGPVSSSDSEGKVSWTYGTVEARLRVPAGRGLWPALWMLPLTRESKPEIDILEVIGQDPRQALMHLHPRNEGDAGGPGKTHQMSGKTLADGWHTIRLDWQPERLTWFIDGEQVWHLTGSQVPDEPMYLVLNLAVGGVYPGPPDATTKFPATFEIDRIRVTKTS